jgi:hypothetical protein
MSLSIKTSGAAAYMGIAAALAAERDRETALLARARSRPAYVAFQRDDGAIETRYIGDVSVSVRVRTTHKALTTIYTAY